MAPTQGSWEDFFFYNMGFTNNIPVPADVTHDVPGGTLWEVQGTGGSPEWYSRKKVTLFTDGVLQLKDESGQVTLTPGTGTTLMPHDCLAVICRETPIHYPVSLPGTTTPLPKAAQRGWAMVDAVFVNKVGRRTIATRGNTPGMILADLTTAPQPRYVSQRFEWDTGSVVNEWCSFCSVAAGALRAVDGYGYGSPTRSLGIDDLDGITVQVAGGPNTLPATSNSWGSWVGTIPDIWPNYWNSVGEFPTGDMDVTDLRPGLFIGNELGDPPLITAVMCVDTAKWLARTYMFGGEYP